MGLKMDVHITIDRAVWKEFQVHCERLGVYPSAAMEVFCRCIVNPDLLEDWAGVLLVGRGVEKLLRKK